MPRDAIALRQAKKVHILLIAMSRTLPKDNASAEVAIPAPCACGRLRRASRALTQLYDDVMAPSGLRVTQFSVLRTLSAQGPRTISDLAERQLLDRTALSRHLDPLVKRGLVCIGRGDDARTRHVSLTPAGARELRNAEGHWKQAQRQVECTLGADRFALLIDTLRTLEGLHPDLSSANRDAHRDGRVRRA